MHEDTDKYDHVEPIYSLEKFRKVFLAEEDFTEYKPALKLIGSWEEWERIKKDWPGFKNYIEDWKEELELLLTGRAMKKIIDLMDCGTKSTEFSAARFLARSEWIRNIKEAAEKEQKRQDRKAEEILEKKVGDKEDWDRVQKLIALPGGQE